MQVTTIGLISQSMFSSSWGDAKVVVRRKLRRGDVAFFAKLPPF